MHIIFKIKVSYVCADFRVINSNEEKQTNNSDISMSDEYYVPSDRIIVIFSILKLKLSSEIDNTFNIALKSIYLHCILVNNMINNF